MNLNIHQNGKDPGRQIIRRCLLNRQKKCTLYFCAGSDKLTNRLAENHNFGGKMKKGVLLRILSSVLCISLAGCGSSSSSASGTAASGSSGGNTTNGTLHFELDTGVLDYTGYEYVSKGFYSDSSENDPEKTIVLNFNYTNKENTPKNYMSDFWITTFQNGTELDGPSGYYSDQGPESLQNAYDEVLQNGVITIGDAFVLQDYSPVTVIVRHNGGKEVSDQMLLEIEEYADNSFDIDRLYGYWEGKGDTALTLTSSQVKVQKTSSSSTYIDSPRIWTDEEYLYTNLSEVEKLKIEEQDGVLHLSSDKYEFTQVENWPESGVEVELQTVSMGETITTEFAELTFTDSGNKPELKYSNTTGGSDGSYGGHITFSIIVGKETPGKQHLYLEGTLKNTSSTDYDPENIRVKAVINGSTELEGDASAIDAGKSVSSLNPLNSATVVLHTEVDSSVVNDISSLEWYIGFDRSFSGSSRGDPSESRYYYVIKGK